MNNEKMKESEEGDKKRFFFHSFHLFHSFISSFSISSFILSFLILTGLAQAIWGLLQLYGFLPSFNGNFKITGTFFNPAPYAMYLAVIFPMSLGEVMKNEKLKIKKVQMERGSILLYPKWAVQFFILNSSFFIYYLFLATVIAIILVLPATMIRAAWLAAVGGAFVVAWPWLKRHTTWLNILVSNIKYRITALVLCVILVAAIGAGLYHLKKGSSVGKLFIWEVTLNKIAERPLFGYGVGRFEAEYNNWQAEYFQEHPYEMKGPKGMAAGNTKYCFNEFLEMTSETGVIGLLLFFSLMFFTLESVKQIKTEEFNVTNKRINSSFFLFSFFILSFLSFPFFNLPLLLVFFVVLAVISIDTQAIIIPQRSLLVTGYAFATVLLTLGVWLGFDQPKNYIAYKTWQEASFMYNANTYDISEKEYEKVYPLFKYNNEFLQQYGKCLAMNKDLTKAKIILNDAEKFGGDYMLYANLGDVYKELKQYPQAEIAYEYAAGMVPHKLYPHYLLAKLYMQSGDHIKAITKAKEVLAMNAKVNTSAENEMKHEVKIIINQEKAAY